MDLDRELSEQVVSYALSRHRGDLMNILRSSQADTHYSVYFHFLLLLEAHPKVTLAILKNAVLSMPLFDAALVTASHILYRSICNPSSTLSTEDQGDVYRDNEDDVQGSRGVGAGVGGGVGGGGPCSGAGCSTKGERDIQPIEASVKKNIHFRIVGLPYTATHPYPRNHASASVYVFPRASNETREGILPKPRHFGMFLSVSGTVVKAGSIKMIENSKIYRCLQCCREIRVRAEYERCYSICAPKGPCCIQERDPDGGRGEEGSDRNGQDDENYEDDVDGDVNSSFATTRRRRQSVRVGRQRGCRSTKYKMVTGEQTVVVDGASRRDFQEIKIQEKFSEQSIGFIPYSLVVTLENDLVDQCQPGDDVTVTGTVLYRWLPFVRDERCGIELVMQANSIVVHNKWLGLQSESWWMGFPQNREQNEGKQGGQLDGQGPLDARRSNEFGDYWKRHSSRPFRGRNAILQSFCPQIRGHYYVKLAVAIVLAGGVEKTIESSGTKVRGQSHILLIGDPGIAKSQLLKFAAKLVPRSVFTTGIGSSGAGLTASAVNEAGQWFLEAGALVLADGGVCCIDEFSTMLVKDRAAIHEAMEQQTISVAKAGMVCRLNARCSVLAACNAKGGTYYDPMRNLEDNCGLETPLLSRFDLVFILLDTKNRESDEAIARHILDEYALPTDGSDAGSDVPGGSDQDDESAGDGEDEIRARKTSPAFAKRQQGGSSRSRLYETQDSIMSDSRFWTFERMRSYFCAVKQFTPLLTPAARRIFSEYYEVKRQENADNSNQNNGSHQILINVRMLESLIRLAQGHARLLCKTEAGMLDALVVVQLMETSLRRSDGEWLHCPVPEDPTLQHTIEGQRILDWLNLDYEILEKMDRDHRMDQHDLRDLLVEMDEVNNDVRDASDV